MNQILPTLISKTCSGDRWPVALVLPIVLSLALLALAGCDQAAEEETITASGFIEGKEILISSEVSGRVAELRVGEGDPVEPGQLLVVLDDALLQTERSEAAAAASAAAANLAQVEAGPRPAELTAAQAALHQAEAERDGALDTVENAEEALENPQELNAQIVEAETQVALAEQELEMAEADLNETEILYSVYADQGGDAERTWSLQVDAAWAAIDAAQARLDGARRYLNTLYATRQNPLTKAADLHRAETEAAVAEATVEQARAALDELRAGPTEEEVTVAQAQLHQAEAALALIDARLAQLRITSPMTGLVSSRSIHQGETASAGSTLLTLVNLDQVTLVVYIPADQIGRVQVGQPVEVTVDSFPDRIFEGEVTTIAREAEFTPRNVQTQEERVNLVFAVQVTIPNPDHLLKPGMPADAVIQE
jgi:multidrug resistance efflux pump